MRAIVKDVPVGTNAFVGKERDIFLAEMSVFIGQEIEVKLLSNGFYRQAQEEWCYHPDWLEIFPEPPTRDERITAVLRQIAECDSLEGAHQLASKALEE